jgi:hyperosmotically inducible periplasmic protein
MEIPDWRFTHPKDFTEGGEQMNRGPRIRICSLFLGASMLLSGLSLFAAKSLPSTPQQTAPDNSKNNKGDMQKDATTADQQNMNPGDLNITKKIRAAITDDKSLSTYAHNIKVITQDGKVVLKGPVRTEKEKAAVENKAAAVAGDTNVTSEITIAPPKS